VLTSAAPTRFQLSGRAPASIVAYAVLYRGNGASRAYWIVHQLAGIGGVVLCRSPVGKLSKDLKHAIEQVAKCTGGIQENPKGS